MANIPTKPDTRGEIVNPQKCCAATNFVMTWTCALYTSLSPNGKRGTSERKRERA